MKSKITSILFLFLLIFGSLSVMFLSDDAKGTSFNLGFEASEGSVLTHQFSNSWITTDYRSVDTSYVTDTEHYEGSRSYLMSTPLPERTVWWNYTYSDTYMIRWECMYKSHNPSFSDAYIQYVIDFLNESDNAVLIEFGVRFSALGKTSIYYHSATTGWILMGEKTSDDWKPLSFNYNSIDNVTYIYGDIVMMGAPFTISTKPVIKSMMHMDSGLSGGQLTYFDSHKITTGDDFYPVDTVCGYDMSPYDTTGTITYVFDHVSSSPHIFEQYKLPSTTTIEGVELAIGPSQYVVDTDLQTGDLSHYTLTINDNPYGIPDCLIKHEGSAYAYSLFWKTDLDIDNTTITFDFYHDNQLKANNYWYPATCGIGVDGDLDGDISYGQDVIIRDDCYYVYIPIGLFRWFWICDHIYSVPVIDQDLSYRFFHTPYVTQNLYNYTDLLGLSGYSSVNSTGYIYDLNDEQPIICSYTIGDPSFDYTIELWKNGTQISNTVFPYLCAYPGGTVGLNPDSIGTYVFKLKKVGYVYNITAYVIGALPQYSIRTQPPLTDINEPYNVLYRYFHPQGNIGSCGMFNILEYIDNYDSRDYGNELGDNITGSFLYNSIGSTSEYWSLFTERNGLYYRVGKIAKHFIRLPNVLDNVIICNQYSLTITPGNPEQRGIIITGNHIFPGSDVSIYVGNVKQVSVGDSQLFTYHFYPQNPGVFQVDLRIVQNGTSIILAIAPHTLTVVLVPVIAPPPSDIPDFITNLPLIYKLIIGVVIIVLLTLIPLIVSALLSRKTNITVIDIPNLVYVSFFLVGVIVSVILGFFDIWILFFILMALILVLAILWVQRKIAD